VTAKKIDVKPELKKAWLCPLKRGPSDEDRQCDREACMLWIAIEKRGPYALAAWSWGGCGLVTHLPWELERRQG